MKALFLESSKLSMGRVLSLIVVLSGVSIGLILALTGKLNGDGVLLSTSLVATGMAGKIVQKSFEVKK